MASTDPQKSLTPEESKERSNVPIELSEMSTAQQNQGLTTQTQAPSQAASSSPQPQEANNSTGADHSTSSTTVITGRDENLPPIPPEPQISPPPLIREATGPAIGPATDKPSTLPKEPESDGPALYITLLLTTGARHPFKLDRKYLKKRNVEVEDDNPVNMSLYKLKELILRDWREEWEAKPSSPDSIRLISMGKLLTDKSKLSDFGFKEGAAPTIVHMTIKPQEIVDEEEANKNVRDREDSERTPRCRCLIM